MLKRWFGEYKSSLKLVEVEEFFDLFYFRPLAFLLVKSVYNTNYTPNQITETAIIFSVLGGIIFAFGTPTAFVVGALLFMLYNIFDCADGQLARLKGNGSNLGRIIDGFGDYIAGVSVYLAIGFGFANNTNDPLFFWMLTIAAGFSNVAQSMTLDYYRNRYLDYAFNRDLLLGESLNTYYHEFNELKKEKGYLISKSLFKIYFWYCSLQFSFSSKSSKTEPVKYDRDDFLKKNKIIIRFWTFLGPTTQWTFFIITAMFNRMDVYLWGLAVVLNWFLLIIIIIQKILNKKIKRVTI